MPEAGKSESGSPAVGSTGKGCDLSHARGKQEIDVAEARRPDRAPQRTALGVRAGLLDLRGEVAALGGAEPVGVLHAVGIGKVARQPHVSTFDHAGPQAEVAALERRVLRPAPGFP